MEKKSKESLRSRTSRPLSNRALETMVGIAIVLWTIGEVVFRCSSASTWQITSEFSLKLCFEAAAFGCAIAVIASKRFDFNPVGLVAVGTLLFTVITVWNQRGDISALVLVLLLIAARGMDLRRLVRFYVAGATASLVLVLLLTKIGLTPIVLDAVGTVASSGFGFMTRPLLGTLILSIIISLAFVSDEPGMRIPLAIVCVLCGIACFLIVRTKRVAVLMVLVGILVFGKDRIERWLAPFLDRQEFRWLMAALPIVLLCLSFDSKGLYPIASIIQGGYRMFSERYGMAVTVCFGVLYVRSVLLAKPANNSVLPWLLLCVTLLALVFDGQPTGLELNGFLILLALGMSGQVFDKPEARIAEGGE